MHKRKRLPSLVKIAFAFALVMLTTLLLGNYQGTAQVAPSVSEDAHKPETNGSLPAELLAALAVAHGNYGSLISMERLLSDLETVELVLIGEAHYVQQDMQTAFEIIRILAQRKKIALAVERFPLSLQPDLNALNNLEDENLRSERMDAIMQTDDYQTIWGRNDAAQTGFLDPNQPHYPQNSPSAEIFESLMLWAACERIPVIGMDLPVSDREFGFGENIPYRNELWMNQIVEFLENNLSKDYLVIAVGGINHFSSAPDSVQDKLRSSHPTLQFLSIGQRDVNYPSKISQQVANLALTHQVNDLILQNPQYAVVKQDESAIFPSPPDYWIAAHSVDSWDNSSGCSLN